MKPLSTETAERIICGQEALRIVLHAALYEFRGDKEFVALGEKALKKAEEMSALIDDVILALVERRAKATIGDAIASIVAEGGSDGEVN
jgi:hypothetical protein